MNNLLSSRKKSDYTYTTRLIIALLIPDISKSRKFKVIAIGDFAPWLMSIWLMCNGSSGGIANPLCPFGCFCTISVITFGKQSVSAALHRGISVAIYEQRKQNNINHILETLC